MPFQKPRFLERELSDSKQLARVLEAAFDGVSSDSVALNLEVSRQATEITNIQEDITEVTNIIIGTSTPTAIVEAIPLTATGDTFIYTLPTGFGFISEVWLVGNSVSGAGVDPVVSLKIASASDVALGQTVAGFTQTPTNQQVFRFPQAGSSKRMAAGDSLYLTVDTASTRSAFVVDCYLYLLPT